MHANCGSGAVPACSIADTNVHRKHSRNSAKTPVANRGRGVILVQDRSDSGSLRTSCDRTNTACARSKCGQCRENDPCRHHSEHFSNLSSTLARGKIADLSLPNEVLFLSLSLSLLRLLRCLLRCCRCFSCSASLTVFLNALVATFQEGLEHIGHVHLLRQNVCQHVSYWYPLHHLYTSTSIRVWHSSGAMHVFCK